MNRLYYALIHPTRLAMYVKDKLYIPILYSIFFIILSILPKTIRYVNKDKGISTTEYSFIVNQVSKDSNASFSNYTFKIDTPFSITDSSNITYNFDTTNTLSTNKTTYVFVFTESSLVLYNNGVRAANTSYETLKFNDVNLNDIFNNSASYYSFKNIYNTIYETYFSYSNEYYIIQTISDAIFTYLIIIALLFIVSAMKCPYLKASNRFTLILYSLTWTYICIFIGNYYSLGIMPYLGAFISTFCLIKALSSIRVIKVNKGE